MRTRHPGGCCSQWRRRPAVPTLLPRAPPPTRRRCGAAACTQSCTARPCNSHHQDARFAACLSAQSSKMNCGTCMLVTALHTRRWMRACVVLPDPVLDESSDTGDRATKSSTSARRWNTGSVWRNVWQASKHCATADDAKHEGQMWRGRWSGGAARSQAQGPSACCRAGPPGALACSASHHRRVMHR